jgi:hypothetical protein
MPMSAMRPPRFGVLLGLVWLLVAAALLAQYWATTAETLLDTDDAMRLVQMRAWLAGQGWFDLHQPRLQPPLGYDPHWSRLIDVGLAGYVTLLGAAVEPAQAERLMRATWPLLWLLPTMSAMAAIAWRLAGREAAVMVLLLAALGIPAYQQFTPGRIDHHNVQIALTMLAVAATVWSDRVRLAAMLAGALTALTLAVGFEALPYLALCGAAMALRYVVDRAGSAALCAYGISLAVATLAAFLISVGPERWGRSVCDALAVNLTAGAIAGGLLLALAGHLSPQEPRRRAVAVAVAAVAAAAITFGLEPRCLGGPYAMVDPAIWPAWLADVRENLSLVAAFRKNPLTATGIVTFPAVALVGVLLLARERRHREDFAFLTAGAMLALAIVVTVAVIRADSYAIWLGMPFVAAVSLQLCNGLRLKAAVARFAATLLLTPMVLSAAGISLVAAAGYEDKESFSRPASRSCFRTDSYAPLARLRPGLVAGDTSFGPYLLALTPHMALAAPYHRLSAGILAAHRALTAPPRIAREILDRWGVDYVVICDPFRPSGLGEADAANSLWGRLRAGDVPSWLESVPETEGRVLRAYRLRRGEAARGGAAPAT